MTNVVVSVTGTQRDESGEENRIELVTAGRYYRKHGVDYFTYSESELTGLEGTTTLLKVYEDAIVLVRMGKVDQRQEFRRGEFTMSTYITPYGALEMGVGTKAVTIDLAEGIGQIMITYDLEIEGQWQSLNKLAIHIREDNGNGH